MSRYKNKNWLIAIVKISTRGMALLLVSGWLWVSSAPHSAPTTPRPETGNVFPFNNHGKIVYLTKFEDRFFIWFPAGIAILVLAGVLSKKWIASMDRR